MSLKFLWRPFTARLSQRVKSRTMASSLPSSDRKVEEDEAGGMRSTPKKGTPFKVVDVETSKAYLKSDAFRETYGDLPVWHESMYRRNFRGHYDPVLTRPSCVQDGVYLSNHSCPVCRDDHLNIHHENIDLLHHFIEEQTGEIISLRKTKICQRQHLRLEIAVGRARDRGMLEMRVPERDYDYAQFYGADLLKEMNYEEPLTPEETAFLVRSKDVAGRQIGRNDVRLDAKDEGYEEDELSTVGSDDEVD